MPSGTQQNEVTQLQSQIAAEIKGDVPAIAQGIFGDNKNHPDMAQVPNDQLDQIYVQHYQQGDRQWLQSEAQRDPQQFLDVAKRIGVTLPNPTVPGATPSMPQQGNVDPTAMAKMLSSALQPQAPPAAAASAGLPAAVPASAPPPALPAAPPALGGGPVVGGPSVGAALVPPPGPAAPPPIILGPNGQPLPPSIPGVTG